MTRHEVVTPIGPLLVQQLVFAPSGEQAMVVARVCARFRAFGR